MSAPAPRTHHYDVDGDAAETTTNTTIPSKGEGVVGPPPCKAFYGVYHGHTIDHLSTVLPILRSGGPTADSDQRSTLFLMGDSSFDNKYWFTDTAPACNGYERALAPSSKTKKLSSKSADGGVTSKQDMAYWFNKALVATGNGANNVCVNAAVEESTLSNRFNGELLEHDEFVRDNLRPEDTLVISVGGNDIALKPSLKTILNMAALVAQPKAMIKSGWCIGTSHFQDLFKTKLEGYIKSVTAKVKPKLVVICMIYYPNEIAGGSWADKTLGMLGYDRDPSKLQLLIKKFYEDATCKIEVEGVPCMPFPLFEVLDGKTPADYCQRVEPSSQGGEKIAATILDQLIERQAL